ncbi:hypothetical protein SD961_01530 [Erwinia sp. MMLR14_017]|uniref:hypothetical protein n=1 Tax=Erwinia sp. MMLR14_017 TaxID=3093842 RepID=UPI00298FC951|nr:hypothetical protein [Erwinia sp. MMLR14_017]MDW8844582.1 hypothetical protein [Erwinia sp. MMLR14_017]
MTREKTDSITALQHHVNQAIPHIIRWYSNYALNGTQLQQINQLAADFQVRLPLARMFGSGKPRLLTL